MVAEVRKKQHKRNNGNSNSVVNRGKGVEEAITSKKKKIPHVVYGEYGHTLVFEPRKEKEREWPR